MTDHPEEERRRVRGGLAPIRGKFASEMGQADQRLASEVGEAVGGWDRFQCEQQPFGDREFQ